MDANASPKYLRSVAEAVARFRVAFECFLELHKVNEWVARGVAPAVFIREGVDPTDVAMRERVVSEAAGAASDAVSLTNSYMVVQGFPSPVDAIVNWQTVTRPKPLLEARDVLDVCAQVLGRLDAMIRKAEAATDTVPQIGPAALHPTVWSAAARYWTMHLYRDAVRAAAEALAQRVKDLNGRNDVAQTSAWQQVFSKEDPQPGRPRLRWPGDPTDRDVKTMNDGLRQFAPGLNMTIRNPATHKQGDLGEQEAFEQLAALSLLARWMDQCEVATGESIDESPSIRD